MFRLFLVLSLVFCAGNVAEAQRLSSPVLKAKKLSGAKVHVSWKIDRESAEQRPTLRLFRSVNNKSYGRVAEFSRTRSGARFTDSSPGEGTIRYRALIYKGGAKSRNSKVVSVTINPAPQAPPEPTPVPSENFDEAGNVTPLGKILFAIPGNLSGNVYAGKAIVDANCSCHSEKVNRTFTFYKGRLPQAPMYFNFSDPDLANLTAYLNRFRR